MKLTKALFLMAALLTPGFLAHASEATQALSLNSFAAPANRAEAAVQAIYRGALYRDAEPRGLKYWSRMLKRRGANGLAEVGQGIGASEEFNGQMRARAAEDIVTNIYRYALGRQPDAEGLAHWSELLRQGFGGEVVAGIMSSPEFRNRFGF